MNEAVSHAERFRHVVFPDAVGGCRRGVHVGLRPAEPALEPAAWPPEPLSPEAESFLRWLTARCGPNFHHYKRDTLARRLPACLRALRAPCVGHALARLEREPHLAARALDALLIGVTSFYRDPAVFDGLLRDTLPNLLRDWRAAAGGRKFRVWSAGCSDGAELYTVAMLLAELGPLSPESIDLVGTDCRPDALRRAAAGVFEPGLVTALPAAFLARHFAFDGGRYHVRPALRAAVRWRRADVLAGAEQGPWDLVLCRNLGIYLQPEQAAALWVALARVLRPGGVLVLGKAERPVGATGMVPTGACAFRRTDIGTTPSSGEAVG